MVDFFLEVVEEALTFQVGVPSLRTVFYSTLKKTLDLTIKLCALYPCTMSTKSITRSITVFAIIFLFKCTKY